jgi:mRNA interferase RelE/StbE
MYRIVYAARVPKEDLPFIAKSARELVVRAIMQRLATAPLNYGEGLRYKLSGMRRLRVSDYRIIYRVDEVERVVTIEAIGHRRDIYDQ